MTEHRFNFHTVDHQELFKRRMEEVPTRLTGATIIVGGQIEHMPGLFPNLASTYGKLLGNLRSAEYISSEPSMLDDFSVIAFPRVVVSFNMLDTVDMIVSMPDGSLLVEIFLNYKGGTSIMYSSKVHTGIPSLSQSQAPVLPDSQEAVI